MENFNNNTPTESQLVDGQVIQSTNKTNKPDVSSTKVANIRYYPLNQYEFQEIVNGTEIPIIMTVSFLFFSIFAGYLGNYILLDKSEVIADKQSQTFAIMFVTGCISFVAFLFYILKRNRLDKLVDEIKSREETPL
jgi:hypothetical protein